MPFRLKTYIRQLKGLQVLYPERWVEGKVIACQQAMTDSN